MVIGNGMIAKRFAAYGAQDEFLIFASGVSDSKTSGDPEFKREHDLLRAQIEQHPGKRLVYFSTCSIYDQDLALTPYVRHKLNMERLILQRSRHHHIFRLSNLAGHSANPHTVLNFFYFHIARRQHFELWKNSERNIIDVDDVFRVVEEILSRGLFSEGIVNIANLHNYKAPFIVRAIEAFTGKRAVFTQTEKGAPLSVDLSGVEPLFEKLQIAFDANYLDRTLKKYYPIP